MAKISENGCNRVRINDEAVVFESMSELQTVWICNVVTIQNAERPDNTLRLIIYSDCAKSGRFRCFRMWHICL